MSKYVSLIVPIICGLWPNRVTSLDQLSVAEFSGGQRPKVNENGLKNVLGIWFDLVLVLKVNYSTMLIFKVIFLSQKAAESLQFFFH